MGAKARLGRKRGDKTNGQEQKEGKKGAQQCGKGISNAVRMCVVRSRRHGTGSEKSLAAIGAHANRCVKERYARCRSHDETWGQAPRRGGDGDCVDVNDDHGSPRDTVYHGIAYMAWRAVANASHPWKGVIMLPGAPFRLNVLMERNYST